MCPLPKLAFIDNEDLHIFLTAQWETAATVEDNTEEQLRHCIRIQAFSEATENQLFLIDQAVNGVKMNMSLFEAEDCVWILHGQYLIMLKIAGFVNLIEKKSHIAIGHILKRVQPTELRNRMNDIIKWRKDDNFDRKCSATFMRELVKQANRFEHKLVFNGREGPKIKESYSSEAEYIDAKPKKPIGKKGTPESI